MSPSTARRQPRRPGRARVAVFAAGVVAQLGCGVTQRPGGARGTVLPATVAREDRATLRRAALGMATSGGRDTARAIYQLLLARDPRDDETRTSLARLDAWDGYYATAERRYRDVLRRHPDDAEVRAGLVDVLIWWRRWEDARREIEAGLARTPQSPDLLERVARIRYYLGDLTGALEAGERSARARAPSPELEALRDRVYHGEVRVAARHEALPAGWDDVDAVELTVTQSINRTTLSARTEQSRRFASIAAPRGLAYNALYAFGGAYRFAAGWSLGAEFGIGAPAPVVPRWLARVNATAPLGTQVTLSLAYSFWSFLNEQAVHIVNPIVAWSPRDDLRLEVRYWFGVMRLPENTSVAPAAPVATVHSAGLRAQWRLRPRVEPGLEYIYGGQLERLPGTYQIATMRSHLAAAWLDLLVVRAFGLRPLYRFEWRSGLRADDSAIPIHTLEMAVYARW